MSETLGARFRSFARVAKHKRGLVGKSSRRGWQRRSVCVWLPWQNGATTLQRLLFFFGFFGYFMHYFELRRDFGSSLSAACHRDLSPATVCQSRGPDLLMRPSQATHCRLVLLLLSTLCESTRSDATLTAKKVVVAVDTHRLRRFAEADTLICSCNRRSPPQAPRGSKNAALR
jgi:hypothetical protein